MKLIPLVTILLVLSGTGIAARETLAVLPIGGTGVDRSTRETVHQLLLSEIRQQDTYDLVSRAVIDSFVGESDCTEPSCAMSIGRQVGASKAVVGNLNRLGEKIIFQYALVNVGTGEAIISDDMGSLRVEDLDQVTKRVALSICQQVPADKTVEVGLVTEQETQDVRSRKANATWGIGFGYLYPTNGYDDEDRIFVWDFRSLYELRHISIDAVLGLRKGVSLNVGVLYIPSRKDFSPIFGGGVGFHAVAHKLWYHDPVYGDYYYGEEKSYDGFELVLKAGFIAFRTYDFRLIANVEYTTVFNDFDDQGVVLTISVMKSGRRVFGIF